MIIEVDGNINILTRAQLDAIGQVIADLSLRRRSQA